MASAISPRHTGRPMLATSSATSAGLRKRVGSVAAAAWLAEVEKAEVETVELMAGNLGLEGWQVWAENPMRQYPDWAKQ